MTRYRLALAALAAVVGPFVFAFALHAIACWQRPWWPADCDLTRQTATLARCVACTAHHWTDPAWWRLW